VLFAAEKRDSLQHSLADARAADRRRRTVGGGRRRFGPFGGLLGGERRFALSLDLLTASDGRGGGECLGRRPCRRPAHGLRVATERDRNHADFARGNYDKAEKYVRAAWVLGEHGEVGDHLAQIYEKSGRKDDAIRTYAMSLSGLRPALETKGRLAKLAGGDSKATTAVEQHKPDLQFLRTLKLGKVAPATGTADFFLLMTSSSAGTKVEAAKFISGEEKLKPVADNLRAAKIDFAFPDDVPTKILRRGVLTCSSSTTECEFVMTLPEDVHSVD
jgi:tetratricopeptide (TPR) repeat protein